MTPAPGLRRVDVVAHRTLRPLTHPAVSDRVLLSAGNQAPPWRFPCHCATITCRERIICMKALDRNSKPPNSRTVLVLDDDVLVRMPVVQFLRDCGYRVVEAASTDEAMAIFQKTNFHVDVVLSEIDIPGSMNGFGFAQWARSVRPELKILLAGTPERTVRNAAELCEVGPTLKRPYDHKRVLHRIKRLLAARAQQGRR
jgi:response regulator RpfG family c-di-GMP phosphodiesterase